MFGARSCPPVSLRHSHRGDVIASGANKFDGLLEFADITIVQAMEVAHGVYGSLRRAFSTQRRVEYYREAESRCGFQLRPAFVHHSAGSRRNQFSGAAKRCSFTTIGLNDAILNASFRNLLVPLNHQGKVH